MAGRPLSPTLAAVVEELELDQPVVVTADDLSGIVARHGLGTPVKVIAARLRGAGWLLPTPQRGVWEFAPGAHAGAIGHGDPTLPLRSALAAAPGLPAGLALGTAAWALGFADRVPGRLDVAVPAGVRVPAGLRKETSVTTYATKTGYIARKQVPCHRPEAVLAHLATTPSAPRSWGAVLEWLPDLAAELDHDVLTAELDGRPRAVRVRAGYLLSGLRPDLAAPLAKEASTVVRFGPRTGELRRHAATWQVMDYLLPTDPRTWEPA